MHRLLAYAAVCALLVTLHTACNSSPPKDVFCPPCPSCALDPQSLPKSKVLPKGVLPPHSAATTQQGPEQAVLYHLVSQYEPALFNHRGHLSYAANCTDCHHHAKSVEDFPPCRECHGVAFKDISRPGLKGAYHRQCMNCHRQLGSGPLGCVDCHKQRSDKDDAAKLAKNNAPQKASLGHLAKEYPPVVFNHKLHEDVSDNCATCHHKPGEVELTAPCRECHGDQAKPGVKQLGLKDAYHKQCLSCHQHMGGDAPQQCAGCHKP